MISIKIYNLNNQINSNIQTQKLNWLFRAVTIQKVNIKFESLTKIQVKFKIKNY